MKKFYICLLFIILSTSTALAENWINISGTTIDFDKDNIKNEGNNIYSVLTKSPAKDGLELVSTLVINCSTQRFNLRGYKLYNPSKQKYVYQQYLEPDWTHIPKNSNVHYLYYEICPNRN